MGNDLLTPRRWARGARLGAALLVAWTQGAPLSAQDAAPRPRVEGVEVRSDRPLDTRRAIARLAFAAGDVLSEESVRATLRNVQAADWGSDVEILTRPGAGGGVVAIVSIRATPRVASVELVGSLGLPSAEVRRELDLQEGDAWSEQRRAAAVAVLSRLYLNRGFSNPQVEIEPSPASPSRRIAVRVLVRPGPRLLVGAIRFVGDEGRIEVSRLAKALRLKAGTPFEEHAAQDASERLENWLHRQGYRLAQVELPEVHRTGPAVNLLYRIAVGPRVEIVVEGVSKRLLGKDALKLDDAEGYDEALVYQLATRLRQRLQEKGYADAEVERDERREDGGIRLVLKVRPGARSQLARVVFEGNQAIESARLETVLATSGRRFLVSESGRLVDAILKEDLANLRSFYGLEGYTQARIGPTRVVRDGDRLTLVVPIVEGPRRWVESLTLDGAATAIERLGEKSVRSRLALREGGPFHPLLLQAATDGLRAIYDELGFSSTSVASTVEWTAGPSAESAASAPAGPLLAARVTLRVAEGSPLVVDRLVVRGLGRTRPGIVERFLQVEPGDQVATRRLLEGQRRLYELGIFSRVEVRLRGVGDGDARADSGAGHDLLVTVREARSRHVTYGLGYDTDEGWRGQLGWVHSNLFGRALRWQADARTSDRLRQFRTLLQQPYLGRWPVRTSYGAFRLDETRDAFSSTQVGIQTQAEHLRRDRRLGLLYGYRRVDLEVARDRTLLEVPRAQREIQISSLTPSAFWDGRDDPIDPKRGWTALVQLEQAFSLASANEEFLKLFGQLTKAWSLSATQVLATSLRVGGIEPLGDAAPPDSTLPAGLASREVPMSERFFAGGRTTHRAYGLDLLGRRGETLCGKGSPVDDPCSAVTTEKGEYFPVGGDGIAIFNLDYRFSLPGGLGAVLFLDGGNVWPDWRQLGRQIRWGAGFGLRYASPIGPLRAEIGWKFERLPGESPYEFRISFGNPF
jgi:translocation and assembly module TamA